MKPKQPIILAITGASGAIYGLRTLEILNQLNHPVHLILSPMGRQILAEETGSDPDALQDQADRSYRPDDLGAPISSGSFPTRGMLVVPCSIKTLSGIANSYTENLVQRAADVCLKEGRPLLLAVRETPLHAGHLSLMLQASRAGAVLFPPIPTFYDQPESIDALVNASVGRMLARIGIPNQFYRPWKNDTTSRRNPTS